MVSRFVDQDSFLIHAFCLPYHQAKDRVRIRLASVSPSVSPHFSHCRAMYAPNRSERGLYFLETRLATSVVTTT